jgi:hypothetical protein
MDIYNLKGKELKEIKKEPLPGQKNNYVFEDGPPIDA